MFLPHRLQLPKVERNFWLGNVCASELNIFQIGHKTENEESFLEHIFQLARQNSFGQEVRSFR